MAFEETECSCLDKAMLCNILTDLSSKSEAYFGSEQRGDIALSLDQKSSYAHSVLHKSKEKFVTQYGKFFTVDQFSYFTKNFGDDESLMYHLKLVQQEAMHHKQRVKNRRFTAMKELMAAGEYFSDEQMKSRDPLLYQQMVGQYLTDEEIKSQSENLLRGHSGFSTMLLEQYDSKGNSEFYDRQLEAQDEAMEEEDTDSDDESELSNEDGPTAEERLALREEFLHTMQERFLSGKDREFDYSKIDEDTQYDDITQETRDAEDRYFDDSDSDGDDVASRSAAASEPGLAPDEYDY